MKRKSLIIAGLFIVAILGISTIRAKDDCEVAWDISYEAAWNDCMGRTGDVSYCNWSAWSQANQHALEIGCPPHSN